MLRRLKIPRKSSHGSTSTPATGPPPATAGPDVVAGAHRQRAGPVEVGDHAAADQAGGAPPAVRRRHRVAQRLDDVALVGQQVRGDLHGHPPGVERTGDGVHPRCPLVEDLHHRHAAALVDLARGPRVIGHAAQPAVHDVDREPAHVGDDAVHRPAGTGRDRGVEGVRVGSGELAGPRVDAVEGLAVRVSKGDRHDPTVATPGRSGVRFGALAAGSGVAGKPRSRNQVAGKWLSCNKGQPREMLVAP